MTHTHQPSFPSQRCGMQGGFPPKWCLMEGWTPHGPHQCHTAGDSDCTPRCHLDSGRSRVLLDHGAFGLYPDQEGPGFAQPPAAARRHSGPERASQLPSPPDVGSPRPRCAGLKPAHTGIKHPPCRGRNPRCPLLLLLFPSGPCPGRLDGLISTPTQDGAPQTLPTGATGLQGGGSTPAAQQGATTSHQFSAAPEPAATLQRAWDPLPCCEGGLGTGGLQAPGCPTLTPHSVWGREGWETRESVTACQKNAQPARPPRPLCPRATAAC